MDKPVRKEHRLSGFDYTMQGDYFITVCTKEKRNYFWRADYKKLLDVKDYTFLLNNLGQIVSDVILNINEVYSERAGVDKFVVMPDHIHLILTIKIDNVVSIEQIIGQLKRQFSIKSKTKGIWQKSFYDHIIRNEKDYAETWDYIDANPRRLTGNMFMS